MADIRLTVDGAPRVVAAGLTAGEIFADVGIDAVVVRANEQDLHDLAWVPEDGDAIESVPIDSPEGLAVLRHSSAHVLAQAVQEVFPKARLGIGPPIVNGFYYDFAVDTPFTPDDLEVLEQRMAAIIAEGQTFARRVVTDDEARDELDDEPFKLELIGLKGAGAAEAAEGADVEVGAGELTIYDNLHPDGSLAWKDLCRGPHLPSTAMIPAVRLMRTAAAYWRGSEKNPQLQRIYGTAWPSDAELDAHLEMLAEAEKRDHRKLGAELDLFSFPDEIGSGLAVFHPKGGVIRMAMEDYSRQRHLAAGYSFVNSPHITKGRLFEVSGHLDWYAEGMFAPMAVDGAEYYLKPMNCPMHNLIYSSRGRSYRELPLRLFEFGTVYRYEKSGVVHGLTRARGFTQDDAHIYCTREQMGGELTSLLRFVLDLLADYGLDDFYLELSTKDPVKYVGTDEDWEVATDTLRSVAQASGLELVADPGGAAFYGPKISVQARDAIGRTWQMSTIQLDFNLPERFELEYQAADGSRQRPVMIHRALFGSIERFVAVLTEHYAGAFPAWLAPVQVMGIPIRAENVDYLQQVTERLRAEGIRAEVDESDDRMQKKILRAQQQKIPFMFVAGPRDVEARAVSMRYRNGIERRGVPLDEAIQEVARNIASRQIDPDALNPDELLTTDS
ncbi:MAG TPA: threonine--tRNA ligase [Mycobacteriales bacterium]|nr:threonine--tRNA ligase [Mycobacteriales bacterium]